MIKNIILDFGHGGLDANGVYTTPGKQHRFNDTEIAYEGVLNRQIGAHLEKLLKNMQGSLNVATTVAANDPTDVSLANRVKFANSFPANESIFISIHCNAFNTKAEGFEIFTTKGTTKSDQLAELIANRVEPFYRSLNLKLRYDFTDGDKDKESDFYVLRKTNCPAVLLECLFFDNYKEFKLLRDRKFQKELAYRIYLGVKDYLSK